MSAFKKAKKTEEGGTISAFKPKVRKVEFDENHDNDFEYYKKSDGKPVHVDIDKEVIEGRLALKLPPNKSEEEEMNHNGETMGGSGNISVRMSYRTFKPPDRLGGVPFFWK